MLQLELDFDAIPGIVQLCPYLQRPASKRRRGNAESVIAAFPLSRQRSTIQDVALAFKAKRGKKRQAFWQETVAELRDGLRRTGMAEEQISRQLVAFRDAVERELYPSHDNYPRLGGDAA
jgi:hypothetical protein